MNQPKVLLMHITRNSGHHRATVAIEKALKLINPKSVILDLNGFAYAYPILEKVVNAAYMSVIKRRPQLWDYVYDNPKVVKKTARVKNILNHIKQPKLLKLFNKFKPGVVICSQAFPCGMIGDFKKRYNYPVKLIGVLTDFAPHNYWLHQEVDFYVVPTEEARERLIKDGICQHRIKLLGIPIDPKFSQSISKKHIAMDLGLNPKIKTILVMGGGQGIGPIRMIVQQLKKLDCPFQLVVILGTNKRALKAIQKIKFRHYQSIRILPYVNNVQELMDLADIIITKPGGMTTAECLAKGLPMVIINPIPGQEERNTRLLLDKGIAIKIAHENDIAIDVQSLLEDEDRINKMRNAAILYSKPHAAINIAKLALEE